MKKKYVIFSTDFKPHKGGIAEFVYNIATYLKKKDIIKEIITYTPQGESKFDYPVRITNLLNRKRKLNQRFGDSFLLTRKINTAFHKIILHYLAFRDLKSLLKEKSEIKILIASFYTYDNGIFINMCRMLNFEYEILYHGLDVLQLSRQLPRQFYKNSKKAKRLIFNSKATKDLFNKHLPNINVPQEVIYPYIDTEKTLNQEVYDIKDLEKKWKIELKNKHIISTVAALVKRKGINIAIGAVYKLIKKHPDYIYIIGGKGAEFENLKKQIEKLKLQDNVFLLGLISDKEKWSLLKYSEIFVLPSSGLKNTDWEGFGISYIEASLFDNVVIGGRHGGIVEAVDENKSGYLIDFDQADAHQKLYEKFLYIIANDHSAMKKYAKHYVIENFDIKNFKNKF